MCIKKKKQPELNEVTRELLFSKWKAASTYGFIFCDKQCSLGLAVVGGGWLQLSPLPYTYYIKWLELKIIRISQNFVLLDRMIDWLIDKLINLFITANG